MQFQVPQFIEVEDKIFGPLTFRQFIYVFGGAGAAYLFWRVFPLLIAVPFIVAVAGAAAVLAFLKFNGRPAILAIESAFFYLIHSKLYLWSNARREKTPTPKIAVAPAPKGGVYVPTLSESKLHDLAWSLDIKERVSAGVGNDEERLATRGHEGVVPSIETPRQVLRAL